MEQKHGHEQREMQAVEMKFLRSIKKQTRMDKIWNQYTSHNLKVETMWQMLAKLWTQWCGCML